MFLRESRRFCGLVFQQEQKHPSSSLNGHLVVGRGSTGALLNAEHKIHVIKYITVGPVRAITHDIVA